VSRQDYCRKHDLSQPNLLTWLGRYYERSAGLIPAHVSGGTNVTPIVNNVCEIDLVSGHRINLIDIESLTPALSTLIQRLAVVPHAPAV
tara:strand:+ start:205 stop:471 length:267 start_codon:yes stop_codon:yes gene_type:complete